MRDLIKTHEVLEKEQSMLNKVMQPLFALLVGDLTVALQGFRILGFKPLNPKQNLTVAGQQSTNPCPMAYGRYQA